jgi:uncharacterized FAD-dependent dehydrogenase
MAKKLQFKLDFDTDLDAYISSKHPEVIDFRILSKSLDARGAPRGKKPIYHYIVLAIESGQSFEVDNEKISQNIELKSKPIIIGAGPGGLFAALRFADYGVPTIVIERGDEAGKRMLHISKYWKKGILDTESNVCFGEGGAGLFSDGKLITRVKSSFIKYVMQKFVEFGAPEEVGYLSNPHLGSNKIRKIITKISDHLKLNGHEIRYNQKVAKLIYKEQSVIGVELGDGEKLFSDHIILATGHSAGEVYHHLHENDVDMDQKDFAVGVRIEHPRIIIDQMQHGKFFESDFLGAARYRLSHHNSDSNKGTYSFCMCPGGYVLSSGTEADGIVVNGMSNYARNSRWSNSALVVTVNKGIDFPADDLLAGMDFQHSIERKAFQVSKEEADGRMLPAVTVREFLDRKLNNNELPKTSSPSGIFKTDIRKIFPDFINEHLEKGLIEFNQKLKGFAFDNALLIAPESRTSAPLTVRRHKVTFESTSHSGLYPCGEGAGYAGGITSAAVDGIKIVEAILSESRN